MKPHILCGSGHRTRTERTRCRGAQYEKVLDIAAEQHAYVTTSQTGEHGVSGNALRMMADHETIERVRIGWEHRTPLTPEAAAALRKARENNLAIGDSWVLPSPADPSRPCSRNIMRDWWNAAQERAGLSQIERLGWHSLRRKFANDLRELPLKDLAALGGWKDTRTILVCYLEEDQKAMVEALRNRRSRSGSRGEEGRDNALGEASAQPSDLRTSEQEK